MTSNVDWEDLARTLGSLRDSGESSGTEMARQAIELMLGEDVMQEAVDHYISGQPGSELARAVLWHIQPWSAMERCYEIFRNGKNLEDRRSAVELLRVVADRRVVQWLTEFFNDPDPAIQQWGVGIVDQLAFSQLIQASEARAILDGIRTTENPQIQETITFIESYLQERTDRS